MDDDHLYSDNHITHHPDYHNMSVKPIAEYDAKLLLSHWLDVGVLFLVETARCLPGHADLALFLDAMGCCAFCSARPHSAPQPRRAEATSSPLSRLPRCVQSVLCCRCCSLLLLSLLLPRHRTIARRCESPPPAFISEFWGRRRGDGGNLNARTPDNEMA